MKYVAGKMGMSEGIALSFSVTFPTIFLVTPAAAVETIGSLAWIMPLLSGLLVIGMICLLTFVLNRVQGDLFTVAEALLGKTVVKLIGVYYTVLFMYMTSGWIREFAENTLLTALPAVDFEIVIAWYAALAALLVYNGIENICRVTWVVIPFVIISLLVVIAGLIPELHFFYLMPWQGNGLDTLSTPVIRLAGENVVIILLVILAPSFQNLATIRSAVIYGVGISSFLRSVSIAVFVMVFGQSVAMEKSLPFYELARLVYLNRYIQRLEAIFIIVWVMSGVFAIAMFLFGAAYTIQRTWKLPTMRPLIPLLTFIAIYAAMLPPTLPQTVSILFKMYLDFNMAGFFIIPALLFMAALFKGGKSCRQG